MYFCEVCFVTPCGVLWKKISWKNELITQIKESAWREILLPLSKIITKIILLQLPNSKQSFTNIFKRSLLRRSALRNDFSSSSSSFPKGSNQMSPLVSMNLYESQWISMSLNESEWVWMSLNESEWVLMNLN